MPYLLTHFIGNQHNGEQVYFSVSLDGLHFRDLNEGQPILVSTIGAKGIRDPFMFYDAHQQQYYILATDLSIGKGTSWHDAKYNGSKDLIVWQSQNLIDWRGPWRLATDVPGATNAWAPEAIYDEAQRRFLVIWSAHVEGKHRIYGAYTDSFVRLDPSFVFKEAKEDVIDTTVIKVGATYYRFTKDETSKGILIERSASLLGTYVKVEDQCLSKMTGIEGPQVYPLATGEYCLIVDQFEKGLGYIPLMSGPSLQGGFRPVAQKEYDFGQTTKRHGSVLEISHAQYTCLTHTF